MYTKHIKPWKLFLLGSSCILATVLGVIGYNNKGTINLSATLSNSNTRSSSARTPTKPASSPPTSTSSATPSSSTVTTGAPPTTLGPQLSSTPYSSYAYQIYPGPISNTALQAQSGFEVSVHNQGQTVKVNIALTGSTQPPVVKQYSSADRIYFIEANFGDDPTGSELNLGDDGIIATNSQGQIIG